MSSKRTSTPDRPEKALPDPKDVGSRIATLRVRNNMTEAMLAERMGFSLKHINAVECGRANASLQFILIAARELDTSLDYLLLGKEYSGLPPAMPRTILEIVQKPSSPKYRLLTEYCHALAMLNESLPER